MFRVAAVLALLVPIQTAVAQSYLCTSDMSVGFFFNEEKRSWGPTTFRTISVYQVRPLTQKERYSISYVLSDITSTWGVFKLDDTFPTHRCVDKSLNNTSTNLLCGDPSHGFLFEANSLRFHEHYSGGYSMGIDNNDDTPYIKVGRCRYVQP